MDIHPLHRLPLGAIVLLCLVGTPLAAATSASENGITWTFASDKPTGQFANGEWWVVGPVTITAISPADSDLTDSTDLHGSMLNPMPDTASPYMQSWDSRIGGGTTYERTKNVARNLPLTIQPGNSLVSIGSDPAGAGDDKLCLNDVAVLTVLASAPPAGSFRPPYSGTDKTILGRVSDLDLSVFRSYAKVANTPSAGSLPTMFPQVLLDLISQWPNSSVKAAHAGPNYGRDIGIEVGNAVLALNLDYTPAEKQALLIRLVQRGIDVYGLAKSGMIWWPNGGHNTGRKWMMLMAAVSLHHPDMQAWSDGTAHAIFQEDLQHWYIQQLDIDTLRTDPVNMEPYTQAMLGLPEWASNPITERFQTGSQWSKPYRNVNGICNTGLVLAAEIMGLRSVWNRPALFDYINDRYWPTEGTIPTSSLAIPIFHRNMWNAYRNVVPGNTAPTIASIADQTTTVGVATSVSVMIGDAQTVVGSLQLSATSSNQVLLPNTNVVAAGTTATRTLTLTPVAGQTGSATVAVVVSDGVLSATRSFVLTVTSVAGSPAITVQPADASVTVGQTATFTVTATGAATLTYQWQRNGVAISGATAASYTTPTMALADDNAVFRVVIANGVGAATSRDASLDVSAVAPVWRNQAIAAQTGIFTVEFDAVPSGSGLDSVIGLSDAAVDAYTGLACIVRFAPGNVIDVRYGGVYAAQSVLAYAPDLTYHVRMVVRTQEHTYDVFVTPQGSGEVALATGYAFRSEQAAVTTLANRAEYGAVGSGVTVSSVAVVANDGGGGAGSGGAIAVDGAGGGGCGAASGLLALLAIGLGFRQRGSTRRCCAITDPSGGVQAEVYQRRNQRPASRDADPGKLRSDISVHPQVGAPTRLRAT